MANLKNLPDRGFLQNFSVISPLQRYNHRGILILLRGAFVGLAVMGTEKSAQHDTVDIAQSIEASRSSSRRVNLLKKLFVSVILVVLLLALLFFGRERLAIQEYSKALMDLSQQIESFKSQHQRLPSSNQFQQFKISSRNLSLSDLTYRNDQIIPSSPPETILVYTPMLKSFFYPHGCGIIQLDGKTKRLIAQDFHEKLAKDQRFYNSQVIGKK